MQFLAQARNDLRDVTLPVRVPLVEPVRDAFISVWLQVPKSEVFELLFELPDAQPVREWREDLEGLLSEGISCLFRGIPGCAQSTKLVCQTHMHNPWVLRDRQKHLPQTIRLQSLGRSFAQIFKAGDTDSALSQAGNLNADPFLNRRRVERTLVGKGKQQRACTGFGIHPEFTEELSGLRATIHRLVGALIPGQLASDQHPGSFQAAQIGILDRRLDRIEDIF
jgi:hypothetical protein